MGEKLVLGPLLSVESDDKYVVCFLTKTESSFSVQFNETKIEAKKIANLKSGFFYRVCHNIKQTDKSKKINYKIIDTNYGRVVKDFNNRNSWEFYIPAMKEKIKYLQLSANEITNISIEELTHSYSLLLLDGNHINANKIWSDITELFIWTKLNKTQRAKVKTSKKLLEKLNRFYEIQYLKKWNNKHLSLALASIPTLMMWDNNDIFEGYEASSKEVLNCDICKNILKTARKYFEIFQLRTIKNQTLIKKDRTDFSLAFKFRNQYIIALDKFSQDNRCLNIEEKNIDYFGDNTTVLVLNKKKRAF